MLLGLALVAIPAVLVPPLLRVRGVVMNALAGLIVAASVLVAGATALSLVDRFTAGGMLLAELVAAGGAAGAWVLLGRPRPALPPRPTVRGLWAAARAEPLVAVLAVLMVAAMGAQLFQAIQVVSNAWDPLAYHLSRAAYWIQNQSVTQYPGGTARQLGYPPNGEILQGWTMLLSGGDRLTNTVQWLALVALTATVYSAARLLRFPRPAAFFAGLLFAAMPIPIMEATTSQNDLIAGFFTLAAAVFGLRGLRDGHRGEIAVGVAAIALALGTKGIVVVAGPSLALLLVGVLVRHEAARRALPSALAMAVAALLTLTAYNFVSSLRNTGDLYGGTRAEIARTSSFLQNSARIDAGYLDLPGVSASWADTALGRLAGHLEFLGGEGFALALDTSPNDSTSAFGPVFFLVLVPLLLVLALRPRTALDRRLAAIAALLFFLLFPLSAEVSPDLNRVALPGVALAAPLLATLLPRRALAGATATLAVLVMVPCVLVNSYKPLLVPLGGTPTHALPREQQFATARGNVTTALLAIKKHLPDDAPIAFVGGFDGFDYPFFGPHLERRVVRLLDTQKVTLDGLRALGVRAAVLDRFEPPAGLRARKLADEFWLVLPEPCAGRRCRT